MTDTPIDREAVERVTDYVEHREGLSAQHGDDIHGFDTRFGQLVLFTSDLRALLVALDNAETSDAESLEMYRRARDRAEARDKQVREQALREAMQIYRKNACDEQRSEAEILDLIEKDKP